MDESTIRAQLADLPVPDLRYFPSVGSTNDIALSWAESGAPDCAVVIADEQTSGRGRMNRHWITPPGSALAFSLIFRPTPEEVARSAFFSPLGALAVSETITGLNLTAQIKWPNDVLINGRKLCGILAESVWQGNRLQAVVLGIGLNVTPVSVPPGNLLKFPATCLQTELGSWVDRWELLVTILKEILTWRPRLGSPQFMQTWEDRLAFRGEEICLETPNGVALNGKLVGIEADGGLRLRLADGSEERMLDGDVSLRPAS